MLNRFKQAYMIWRKQRALNHIRKELMFWGVDTSDLSDDEIHSGMVKFARILSSLGLNSDQVENGLRITFSCLRNCP